jgi:hypothetical protein
LLLGNHGFPLLSALRLLRPRTIAQLVKVDQDTRQELRELIGAVRALEQQVSELNLRERQLRAVQRADAEFDRASTSSTRSSTPRRSPRTCALAIASATLHEQPFPYVVVDNLLPEPVFDALIRGLPPSELFADRAVNKQQLTVPFEVAPRYGRRVWAFMAEVIAPDIIAPAMIDKFTPQVSAWLRMNFPALGENPLRKIPMSCSDGRIMLRRPGYYIRPHRDPKWGFLTCLMYLKRPDDDESWGTDLYRVKGTKRRRGRGRTGSTRRSASSPSASPSAATARSCS